MEVLYSAALRRMELARLRSCDVSVEAGTVFVRSGKGGHDRVVPLGPRACRWIARYQRDVRPRLASGLDRGELFLTDFGEPFYRNRLGDRIRRYVARQDLPGACHVFRHACATHMLENGADIRFIQALLGHSQLSTTEIYTRVSIAKLREVHAATHPASKG
jgi:integrase/recombinase XerD